MDPEETVWGQGKQCGPRVNSVGPKNMIKVPECIMMSRGNCLGPEDSRGSEEVQSSLKETI